MNVQTFQNKYETEIKQQLKEEFGIANIMAVPKITKVVVNVGTGDLLKSKEAMERFFRDFSLITGQKPKLQSARVSVAGFNVREGNAVGLTITLRGKRMYAFLERLIRITLPRLRDFRGISKKSFDGQGNYSLGFTEYSVFPEIDLTKIDRPHGMELVIVTSGRSLEQSQRLLELIGVPFEKEDTK